MLVCPICGMHYAGSYWVECPLCHETLVEEDITETKESVES